MDAEEAINHAIDLLMRGPDHKQANVWVAIAAELRAQDTGPALARLLGQVKSQLPPEDPTSRLTLHDVEAKSCDHSASIHPPRIAIRRIGSQGWWMHADDHTNCVD
jgi:hypothetical protein